MELDDPPHDPRRDDPRDRPLAHRLRWGWGDNAARDVRLLAALLLLALVAAVVVSALRSRTPLDTEGLGYVRDALDVPRTDEDLQRVARAVCAEPDPAVALDAVAARASAEVGFPVSREVAHRVREAGCPTG